MAEPRLSMSQDDDLPRTFRRERDAREKQAREAQAQPAMPSATADLGAIGDFASLGAPYGDAVTVGGLEIPFFALMKFFLKAVFAAIPALIVLFVILWGMGQAAQTLFPWLVKMRIVVTFPG